MSEEDRESSEEPASTPYSSTDADYSDDSSSHAANPAPNQPVSSLLATLADLSDNSDSSDSAPAQRQKFRPIPRSLPSASSESDPPIPTPTSDAQEPQSSVLPLLRDLSDDSSDDDFEQDFAALTNLEVKNGTNGIVSEETVAAVNSFQNALDILIGHVQADSTVARSISDIADEAEAQRIIAAATELLFLGLYNVYSLNFEQLQSVRAERSGNHLL
jgi:hypothetical protein